MSYNAVEFVELYYIIKKDRNITVDGASFFYFILNKHC